MPDSPLAGSFADYPIPGTAETATIKVAHTTTPTDRRTALETPA